MKLDTAKILQKRKKQVLELWMKNQLVDFSLREDLMSNDELSTQSEEFVDALLQALSSDNLDDIQSSSLEPVYEVLEGISISRAKQGYSPRETGTFIFSLKDALLTVLQQEVKNDPVQLLEESLKEERK
jgi:rsbT co-antagonist protein RsbR